MIILDGLKFRYKLSTRVCDVYHYQGRTDFSETFSPNLINVVICVDVAGSEFRKVQEITYDRLQRYLDIKF